MDNFAGRTVLITGAASGVGLAMARAFGAAGMNIVLTDADSAALAAAEIAFRRTHKAVLALPLDVTRFEAWGEVADRVQAAFGNVHILCANAGIFGAWRLIEEGIPAQWRAMMEVNAFGPFYGARTFVPRMRAHGEPSHIVITASLAGLYPAPRMGDYTVSKYAAVGLAETLRLELMGSNIGVSLLLPGPMQTRIGENSQKRLADMIGGAPVPPAPASRPVKAVPGMDPEKVAARLLAAIRAKEFYVVTHPAWQPAIAARFRHVLQAFGAPADPTYQDDTSGLARLVARLSPEADGKA